MQQEPYTNCIENGWTQIPRTQMDESKTKKFDLNVNWNDTESVNRLKQSVNKLLSKSSEGIKEAEIYSMFTSASSAMELIERLRFGELALICDIRLDQNGGRSYHSLSNKSILQQKKQNTAKGTIGVGDTELEKEIHNVISALSKKQLERLRTKVESDMKQNNDVSDICKYVNYVIVKREYRGKVKPRLSRAGEPDTKPVHKTLVVTAPVPAPDQTKQFLSPQPQQQPQQATQSDTVFKLQEIIGRKNAEIQKMIQLNTQQTALIRSLSKEESDDDIKEDEDDDELDDLDQYVQILKDLKNATIHFKADYSMMKVDSIGDSHSAELMNPNSSFNSKLNKYSEISESICVCAKTLSESIDVIQQRIRDKYVPNTKGYKEWKLDEIMSWIKSLEHGRFVKHLDVLLYGFKESEISCGELLPDLGVGDLSVAPFNMNNFKDKRDLIKCFKDLCPQDKDKTNKQ